MYVCMYVSWILRYPYWSTQCKAGLSLVDMLKGIWQAALTSLFWSLAELDLGSSCTRHGAPHFLLCGIDKEFSLTDWDGKNILRKYLRSIFRLYYISAPTMPSTVRWYSTSFPLSPTVPVKSMRCLGLVILRCSWCRSVSWWWRASSWRLAGSWWPWRPACWRAELSTELCTGA